MNFRARKFARSFARSPVAFEKSTYATRGDRRQRERRDVPVAAPARPSGRHGPEAGVATWPLALGHTNEHARCLSARAQRRTRQRHRSHFRIG